MTREQAGLPGRFVLAASRVGALCLGAPKADVAPGERSPVSLRLTFAFVKPAFP